MITTDLHTISTYLLARKETLAVAESVTSGLVMASFSLAKNATQFFQGGITAYNLGQKTKQLSVDPILAEGVNSVSEYVSEKMSVEVAKVFCSHWGLGITGYAVPVPALKIRSCYALFTLSYNGSVVYAGRIDTKLKGQSVVQNFFAKKILKEFALLLERKNVNTP